MHADAIALIRSVEQACDTAALTYHDACYWPLVRLRLWSALMQRMVIGNKDGEAVANSGPGWQAVGEVRADLAGPQDLGLLRNPVNAADFVEQPQMLFFTRPEEYAERSPQGAFAKIVDSVRERAGVPTSKIELADPKTLGFARLHPSLFLDLGLAGGNLRFDPPGTLAHIGAVTDAAQRIAGVALDTAALTADMGKIFYFARIFEKLLRRLKPKAFIHSVYYHPVGMGWMLACRRAGVRSVDLQHGRLGPHHGLYTDLGAAPADGYHLLPDVVWCWGPRTLHDIESRKSPACTRHGGLVGGNAWLHKWRYGDPSIFAPADLAAFTDQYQGRRKILVSLQPLDSPVSGELLAAMKQAPPDWLWLLRLHPLRKHTAPAIADLLTRHGVAGFELDRATSFPLFTLLRLADHHVTAFSSVALEAAAFDLRTSLLAPEGVAAFGPEVAQDICRYTPDAAALLAHVHEVLGQPRQPVRSDFFDMNPGVVDRALAELVK